MSKQSDCKNNDHRTNLWLGVGVEEGQWIVVSINYSRRTPAINIHIEMFQGQN